jgi:hypothetical protein
LEPASCADCRSAQGSGFRAGDASARGGVPDARPAVWE